MSQALPTSDRPGDDCHEQSLCVRFDYPVHFTHGVFDAANPLLAGVLDRLGGVRPHRVAVYVDAGVLAADDTLAGRIGRYFQAHADGMELAMPIQVLTGGEAAKTGPAAAEAIIASLAGARLDRHSFVLAVGGGALLDVVGFAASLVHRGLRMVRVPTTSLAQNDAGVGVKTGIDAFGVKNFLGTFAPPFAVLDDLDFLRLLDFEPWIAGVAEAFKVAIIQDAAFLDYLCANAARLARRDEAVMEQVVRRCAVLHLRHIATSGDPFELGAARPLDFGHWSAHRLETMSEYRLGHGQAVAIGVALDLCYALTRGLVGPEQVEAILSAMRTCGLPIYSDLLRKPDAAGRPAVLAGLSDFREHLGGELTITLPDGLGKKIQVHDMDEGTILACIEQLRQRAEKPC